MVADLGEIIKRARSQRDWDQAELARRLHDISQQTVSRWERGLSRPRRAMVGQLALLLSLDVRDLLLAAGYVRPTADTPDEIPGPVRPRLTTLPLHDLTPDLFEQFSADLAQALYSSEKVVRYGGQGHTQGGIDVLVERAVGKPIGIQCKRENRFGPVKVKKAVGALKADVSNCHIYLARVASPQAREEIRKCNNWELWDVQDISRAIRSLPDRDTSIRIIDTYFPGWREPFLGVREPGPWLTHEEYFLPYSGDRIYTHNWQLVGRARELSELKKFLAASDKIALIIGRGGIGKTRLLRALGVESERDRLANLRFLAPGITVEPAQFERLPIDNRLVVIIDDAHERTDNAAIIAGINRVRPEAKVLLSLRPHGGAQLTRDLQRVNLHPSELPSWTLDTLKLVEAEALAREILGADAHSAIAQRLAAFAPDCPLLIVVAATLVKQGKLNPGLLESSDSIRMEVLVRFSDAVTASSANPGLRHEVLTAVAVLQPFRLKESAFQEAISNLTGKAFDQVMPLLRGLEGSGILLRRGASLRVVPDLLGDVILAEAAVDGPSGTSTRYLERVYQAAKSEALQHIFVNASRVDWQIQQDRGGESLIDLLWVPLFAEFQAAGIVGRLTLLKLLEKVSFYQPRHTLTLVRWAIDNPTDTVEEIDHPLTGSYSLNYQDVLNELPPLLKNIAYSLDYFADAIDLLWYLSRHDARPTNQHPDHPVRALRELAAYGAAKPLTCQEMVLDAVQRWLERDNITEWPCSPFEVIKPLLATEVESRISDGLTLTLRSQPVNVEAVQALRSRVLDLAFAEARSSDPKRAVEAVRTIGAALIYPFDLGNHQPTTEEEGQWTPLFVETIHRLGAFIAAESIDPVVSIAVHQALRWHAHHSESQTGQTAREALARIPTLIDHKLAQVLHDGWGHGTPYTGDAKEFGRLRQAWLQDVAIAATCSWSDDEVLDHLVERLATDRRVYGENSGQPGPFVWTLIQNNPSIGDLICRRIAANPTSILRELVPVVMGSLIDTHPVDAVARAHELLATQDLVIQRYVSQGLGSGRSDRDELVAGEVELLRCLLKNDDALVRCLAVVAARTLSRIHHLIALELITTVRFSDSREVAEEVAGAFGPACLSWSELSSVQASEFLAQFHACPSIDGYQIIALLREISRSHPEEVLKVLTGRIEMYEQDSSRTKYEPLPHMWHNGLHFRASDRFVELLRSVRDWMTERVDSWRRQYAGADLFAVVAERFVARVLQVLSEATETGSGNQVRAVGAIVRNAPRTLMWDNVAFVSRTLKAAEKCGEDCVQAVGGGFHAAVNRGAMWGTPGQPFREDIEQRDKSSAIAAKLAYGSIEQRFYRSLAESAKNRIQWQDTHDAGLIDGRDW